MQNIVSKLSSIGINITHEWFNDNCEINISTNYSSFRLLMDGEDIINLKSIKDGNPYHSSDGYNYIDIYETDEFLEMCSCVTVEDMMTTSSMTVPIEYANDLINHIIGLFEDN